MTTAVDLLPSLYEAERPVWGEGPGVRFPSGPFSIIYADPPWRFKCHTTWEAAQGTTSASRRTENHYDTMTMQSVRELPVQALADKDCTLFLWVTMPMLPDGLATMAAWGFKFKTIAFTWAKRTKTDKAWACGMGYWTRANAEICLLGTRGHPKRVAKNVRQLVVSPVGRHSAKPPEVRDRIVALMGDLPRVELFAREITPGWETWGNEVNICPAPLQNGDI